MKNLENVIKTACDNLRGNYAQYVVKGWQRWSGADLKGKAKRYGASYSEQRDKAMKAVRAAGGDVIAVDHGKRVTACIVGQDDYGNAIYDTNEGLAVINTSRQCRLI